MSKYEFTASQSGSTKYFNSLNEYMENNVLHPEEGFICEHKEKCEASCLSENRKFLSGQLHHVGHLYDLKRNGKPFRIIVSGAEYGREPTLHSVQERTDDINDSIPDNHHMRGTLRLLQLLFSRTPDDSVLEATINGKLEKILKAFSLANFLLCSAVDNGSSSQAYTDEMKQNCRNHYQKTLEILKPQMIVLQGNRAWEFFQEGYGISLNHEEANIERIEINGNPTLVLPLYHPSYPRRAWGQASERGYALTNNYVKPAVEKLLKEYDTL